MGWLCRGGVEKVSTNRRGGTFPSFGGVAGVRTTTCCSSTSGVTLCRTLTHSTKYKIFPWGGRQILQIRYWRGPSKNTLVRIRISSDTFLSLGRSFSVPKSHTSVLQPLYIPVADVGIFSSTTVCVELFVLV